MFRLNFTRKVGLGSSRNSRVNIDGEVRDGGHVPPDREYQYYSGCMHSHFGLCAIRDSAIYKPALALETSIANCCSATFLYEYLQFEACLS
jgi:hypothetical protein